MLAAAAVLSVNGLKIFLYINYCEQSFMWTSNDLNALTGVSTRGLLLNV
jgi:hypothetical protein